MNLQTKLYMALAVLLFSCSKYKLDDPVFDVTADEVTVKAGEPVNFNFEGNPQMLSFYSGEFMNDYSYASSARTLSNAYLSFTSTKASGSQNNQLSILVSSDFNGNYDIEDIRAATWTDITKGFVLAANSTITESTEQDIFDLVEDGKPVYIAFRYITRPQAEFGGQRNWNIYSILLTSKLDGREVNLLDFGAGKNFRVFSYGNKQEGRSVVSSTGLLFKGNAATELQQEYTEDWGVSRAAYVLPNDLGSDKSISLKLFNEAKKESYSYTYDVPGTYTATFVAETSNVYGNKKVVKQIQITVTE